jgi:hypothetical protein
MIEKEVEHLMEAEDDEEKKEHAQQIASLMKPAAEESQGKISMHHIATHR